MKYKIKDIEGIGPAYAEKLELAEIRSTDDLLEHCRDAGGRKAVAERSGITEQQLLRWANHADLMRVSGIGGEYAELLEASGVDTIRELRNRASQTLAEKMKQVNEVKKLTRAVPAASTIQQWIEQAKTVEPMITH